MSLREKELFLFDLDGVFSAGKVKPRLIGGRRIVERLNSMKKNYFVLTNTSTHGRQHILRNLEGLGFRIPADRIITASQLTGEFLLEKYGNVRCFIIGEEGFCKEMENSGHEIVEKDADFVVVALDRTVNYHKLNRAAELLMGGSKLVATYVSRMYMDRYGPKLAAGPIVKALEYATCTKAIEVGKPSSLMFKLAMRKAGTKPSETVMVGDQVETDIMGAKKLGIFSVLVLTGVERNLKLIPSSMKPDLVVNNVDELLEYL